MDRNIRVLLGKPGLDGHDRGVKVVAYALKDAGMEVIYTGLHKTITNIINQAVQEDVDAIGLSIMSGAHIPICKKMMEQIVNEKLDDILIIVGGVIPARDVPVLKEVGVHGVFPGGTDFKEIIHFIRENVKRKV